MNTLLVVLALSGVQTADAPPEPNWTEVRSRAEARLTRDAIDPRSAQVTWLSGWRRGEARSGMAGMLSKKYQGWIGCANMNLRNRMGGYAGPRLYSLIYTDGGEVRILDSNAPCYGKADYTPLQPAFMYGPATAASGSMADELTRLSALRDKGVLTDQEFQAQKAKLLAR